MTPEQILALPCPVHISPIVWDCATRAVAELLRKEGKDDSLPVDEEWLRSVGFMRNDVDPFIWINDGYNEWECDLEWWPDEQRLWLESDGMMIQLPDKYKTRGDVRRLCEVLGIELKSEEPK